MVKLPACLLVISWGCFDRLQELWDPVYLSAHCANMIRPPPPPPPHSPCYKVEQKFLAVEWLLAER